MAHKLFVASLVLCLLLAGLAQVPDPAIFGIRDEPVRILFYGGSGLLAGIFGLIALGSGIYLGATRFGGISSAQKRVLWILMLIGLLFMLALLVFRISPA